MNTINPFDDLSERLLELGSSTVKKTAKTVTSAITTVAREAGTQITGKETRNETDALASNYSPLDIESLRQKDDSVKIEQIRRKLSQFNTNQNEINPPKDAPMEKPIQTSQNQNEHFFRKYKDEEIAFYAQKKAREEEEKRQAELENIKRQKEEERKKTFYQTEEPMGKIRRSIFSRMKRQSKPELKMGQGKQ